MIKINKRVLLNLRTIASSAIMLLAIQIHPEKEDLEEMQDHAEELLKINLWELLFNEHFPEMNIEVDLDEY